MNIETQTPLRPTLFSTEILSTAYVIVTAVLPAGTAFASRVETGENCYISTSIALRNGIAMGDKLFVEIAANRVQPEKTPWFVKWIVRRIEQGEGPAAVDVLDTPEAREIMEIVAAGGTWRPHELREEMAGRGFDVSAARCHGICEAFHAKGLLARASVRRSPGSPNLATWFTANPEAADYDEFEE